MNLLKSANAVKIPVVNRTACKLPCIPALVATIMQIVPAMSAQDLASSARPVLESIQGQMFRWSAPLGWKSTETANGVEVAAPDGVTGAGWVSLLRSPGNLSPGQMAAQFLQHAGISKFQQEHSKPLPAMDSGYPGLKWQVQEFEVTYISRTGTPTRGYMAVGVLNHAGGHDSMTMYYAAPVVQWSKFSSWLPVIGNSIILTNVAKLGGSDKVIPARNNPLQNPLIESWRRKGLSEDRISQARREGMMGYERMMSSSGKFYNMPLEAYDGTVGGYRDPARPSEILKKAPTGR